MLTLEAVGDWGTDLRRRVRRRDRGRSRAIVDTDAENRRDISANVDCGIADLVDGLAQ